MNLSLSYADEFCSYSPVLLQRTWQCSPVGKAQAVGSLPSQLLGKLLSLS